MLRRGLVGGVASGESSFQEAVGRAPDQPPKRFEHYELVTGKDGELVELGRGAMGVTYKAFDVDLRCPVTLKVISEKYLGDESARLRFLREARAAASVRHTNVASVLHLGRTGSSYFYAMEFVEGETLENLIKRSGPLEVKLALEIATQVALGLAAVHEQHLVHRDIKPTNVMVRLKEERGVMAKIIDLGLAKTLDESASEVGISSPGAFAGTPEFASPEQFAGVGVDIRSDLYSLGVTLWEMVTGRVPFCGTSGEVMHQHQHVPIPLERLADVPQPVVVLLEKLLEKDPRLRFQNPTELLNAIPVITGALGARRKITRRSLLKTPPSPLTPLSRGQRSPKFLLPLLLLLALFAGISVGAWYLLKPKSSMNLAGRVPLVAPSPTVVQTSEVTPTSSPVNIVLRLHGSNTIGAKLIAALFRGFLRQEGWSNITRVSGKGAEEYSLEGVISGMSAVQSVQIEARGSATAFDSLAKAACDIGMASRKIKPAEQAALTALGDMTSPACEHVLALDGIAVVVSKSNAVASLSRKQIEAIFSGQTTDWSQVGGRPGSIAVYARDDKSGTYDTFKSLVLERAPLSPSAKRFEDSGALSDAVATDPNGIGFIGLPFVRSARAVPVFDEGTAPLMPSAFTVAREDYVLSRRLFLYTPANPRNPLTLRFIQFATSNAGQEIVAQEGFVNQIVKKEDPNLAGPVAVPSPANLPPEYAWLTANAACLNVNFRFRTGSKELDNKALDDLDRVTTYLASPVVRGKQVLLIGFADNKGSPKLNLELSIERAKIVAHQFASRGVLAETSTGFGSAVPVASNETDEGREKNRRVEVWMK